MNRLKNLLIFITFLMVFLGISIQLYFPVKEEAQFNITELYKFPKYFDLKPLEKLHAANEDKWEGVRDIVKFVKNITTSINTILKAVEQAGVLNQSGTFTTTFGGYKIKLVMNDPKSISVTATGTTLEFSNRLIFWNQSTNQKYLEIFFDDPSSKTGGDGAVVTFEPYQAVNEGYLYNSGQKMECYTKDTTMTCSWDGALWMGGPTEKAQLIATNTNGVMSINFLDRLNSTTTSNINTNLGGGCQQNPSGSERYYYTVLALIKLNSPYYTTAAFGVKKEAKSVDLGGCSNSYNYGYFNTNANPNATDSTKYFAAMGSTPPSTDYPATSDIDSLLTQNPTKSVVDNLSINFKSTDTAP